MHETEILRQDFKIQADASKLSEFRTKLCELCAGEGIPAPALRLIVLAVDEAVSNIIEHATLSEDDRRITISVEIGEKKLTVSIRDRGLPFDPTPNRREPDQKSYPRRGFGLYLIHKIVDNIAYERTPDGHNVLTLTKVLER